MRVLPVSDNFATKSDMKNNAKKVKVSVSNLVVSKKDNKLSFDKIPLNACQPAFLGARKSQDDKQHLKEMTACFTPEAENIFLRARRFARLNGAKELEMKHLYYISLLNLKKFIKECDESPTNPMELTRQQLPVKIQNLTPSDDAVFTDEEKRARVSAVVDKHIKNVKKEFLSKEYKEKKPLSAFVPVSASKATIQDMADCYDVFANEVNSNNYTDEYFLLTSIYSHDKKLAKEAMSFFTDIKKALMVDDPRRESNQLSLYDEKADAIWRNLDFGNDAIFLYDGDNKEAKEHLVSNFVANLKKEGQNFKNIDPDKTDIICLNKQANFDFISRLVSEARTDKAKEGRTTIIVADFYDLIQNQGELGANILEELKNNKKAIKNNSNLRFVYSMPPETYYTNVEKSRYVKDLFSTFAVQTIPSLNASDAKKYLTDDKGLEYVESVTKRMYSREAIEKAIELTSNEEGNYPDKTLNFLSGAAKYYLNSEEIEGADLEKYLAKTKELSDIQSVGQSDIIFDTGKRLSDIVGSPMTKADARSIVNQIKAGTIGTKGFRAYLEDGSAYGGGRRHTAEAIAGEAGIPMITINAKEFALKDIDALSQDANLSEMKIRKIVSSAKAQAEANPNKTAMIFINNFDDFAPNPLYMSTSVYQSKAFSQLLAEMENARRNDDVNLIVVGSANTPELIDPNIMKPYKFLNSIIIYPPQDSNERKEVLDYYIKNMELKIAGKNDKERDKIISNIADTTYGFTVVDLIYLLETVRAVSTERGKDKIDGTDFTEAFLQVVSGRPNLAFKSEADKRTVASHEAGHAVALQVMYELAEKQNIPWHLPDKVDFITLDPRGNFGGAMFHKSSENHEYSFEKLMSDLVCSYGGHSAENVIYNMQGSFGITSDMEHVAGLARAAVLDMGMGKNTGVIHIQRNALGSPDVSEKKRESIEEDIDLLVNSGKSISDLIVENYKDFILEFTDKYASKVGTGDCIISSAEFISELNAWREKQSDSKKEELQKVNNQILDIISYAKPSKADCLKINAN